MFGLGTILNTLAVVAGSVVGIVERKGFKQRFQDILMSACGVAIFFIGAAGTLTGMLKIENSTSIAQGGMLSVESILSTKGSMLLIGSLVLGGLLGEWIDIEKRMDALGEKLKKLFHAGGQSRAGLCDCSGICSHLRHRYRMLRHCHFCLSGAHYPGGASDWQFCSRQPDFRFELCGFLPDFLRRHQSDLRQENKGWQPAACLAGTGCVCRFSGVVGGEWNFTKRKAQVIGDDNLRRFFFGEAGILRDSRL